MATDRCCMNVQHSGAGRCQGVPAGGQLWMQRHGRPLLQGVLGVLGRPQELWNQGEPEEAQKSAGRCLPGPELQGQVCDFCLNFTLSSQISFCLPPLLLHACPTVPSWRLKTTIQSFESAAGAVPGFPTAMQIEAKSANDFWSLSMSSLLCAGS